VSVGDGVVAYNMSVAGVRVWSLGLIVMTQRTIETFRFNFDAWRN